MDTGAWKATVHRVAQNRTRLKQLRMHPCTYLLMAESFRTQELLEGERGEWKNWLKTQHSKDKIIASRAITSWQIDGGKVEKVADFIFLGSKVTADGDCSHKIKRCLLFGRKSMTNLKSILKSTNIILQMKVIAMIFPVVTYGCES